MIKQINVENISVSENNVRKQSIENLQDLADNIKEMIGLFDGDGLIHPLTVVAGEKKGSYKVIAGQRRLSAINLLNESEPGLIGKVKCIVVDADEGDQTLLSLAENSFTEQMDIMDRNHAYSALVAKGRSIAAIARSFGTTPNEVKKALALSDLDDGVIKAWRNGFISDSALCRLTTYCVDDQKKIVAKTEQDHHFNSGWQIDSELKREIIDIESALFDVAKSGLVISTDIFQEEQFIEDVDGFMDLQRKAVESLIKEREKEGIECIFYDVTDGYPSLWRGKEYDGFDDLDNDLDGVFNVFKLQSSGRVQITLVRFSPEQEDDVYMLKLGAGLVEPRQSDEPVDSEDTSLPVEPEKPKGRQELTTKDQNYFRTWQQLFVNEQLAGDTDYGHRLMLTMLIMEHGIKSPDEYSSSWHNLEFDDIQFNKSPMKAKVDKLVSKYSELIFRKPSWGDAHTKEFIDLFETVKGFDAVQIQEVMTVIAILGIMPGSGILNHIGTDLDISTDGKWKPDEGFLNALSGNPALTAVGSDLIDSDDDMAVFDGMKIKDKRAKLGELLVDDYKPKYLEFPAQRYGDVELDIENTSL